MSGVVGAGVDGAGVAGAAFGVPSAPLGGTGVPGFAVTGVVGSEPGVAEGELGDSLSTESESADAGDGAVPPVKRGLCSSDHERDIGTASVRDVVGTYGGGVWGAKPACFQTHSPLLAGTESCRSRRGWVRQTVRNVT